MKERADAEKAGQGEADGDTIVPYDGGDFWIERKTSPFTLTKDTCSGICTNVQRSVYRHSPTGFNFGYGGSGPADLALNILRMVTSESIADKYYKEFKWQFLGEQGDKLVIPRQAVLDWLSSKGGQIASDEALDGWGY